MSTLPAAAAVPPPDAARPPLFAVNVKCVASGTAAMGNVPLYAGHADSSRDYELADYKSVRGCRLNRGRRGRGCAAAGSCESGRACDVGELRVARRCHDRECAVVAGDGVRLRSLRIALRRVRAAKLS